MRTKQLLLMISTLGISACFFMPWVQLDPSFSTFAASNASYSGLTLIKGIGYGVQMLSAFGTAYSFPFPAQILYLGYLLWLIPFLGIAGVILVGRRQKNGFQMIRVQSVMSLLLGLISIVAVVLLPDLKLLLSNMLNISFGFVMMNIFAAIALVSSF